MNDETLCETCETFEAKKYSYWEDNTDNEIYAIYQDMIKAKELYEKIKVKSLFNWHKLGF